MELSAFLFFAFWRFWNGSWCSKFWPAWMYLSFLKEEDGVLRLSSPFNSAIFFKATSFTGISWGGSDLYFRPISPSSISPSIRSEISLSSSFTFGALFDSMYSTASGIVNGSVRINWLERTETRNPNSIGEDYNFRWLRVKARILTTVLIWTCVWVAKVKPGRKNVNAL